MIFVSYPAITAWSLLLTTVICTACPKPPHPPNDCIPRGTAIQLVNDYIYHIAQNYTSSIADAVLAENTTVTSQSVNALMGKNITTGLNGPTFNGKAAVIAGETGQPKTLSLISVDVVDCTAIAFRWWGIPGVPSNTPVRAISIFHVVVDASGAWQVDLIFGEFNSVTWGEDTGATVILPPPP